MQASRRKFLQGAAAIPAVAVVGISATPAALAAMPAAEAAAHPFEWWFSYNGGELFTETFNTREQAMQYLEEYGHGMIAECQRQDFDLSMDGESILEALYGQNEDRMNEDGEFIDATEAQLTELGDAVTAAIYAWAEKNKIKKEAWVFGEVRNQFEVKRPKQAKVQPYP